MNHRESGKKPIHSRVIKTSKMILPLCKKNGVDEFEKRQKMKEHLINGMLRNLMTDVQNLLLHCSDSFGNRRTGSGPDSCPSEF